MTNQGIDILIIEKVMGWKVANTEYGVVLKPGEPFPIEFSPSTNITDAWKVVEELQKKWNVNVGTANPYSKQEGVAREIDRYYCEIYGQITHRVFASTAPMAICLAAFKSAGIEIE